MQNKNQLKRGVKKQPLPDFSSLSQKAISIVFGCTPTAVTQWDCPRNGDGTYNLAELIKWQKAKLSGKDKEYDELEKMKLQLQCEKLQHEVDTIKSKSIDIETYEEEVYQRIISIKRFFTEVFMRNLHHYANKPINELRPLMTLLMRDAMNAYANSPQKPK